MWSCSPSTCGPRYLPPLVLGWISVDHDRPIEGVMTKQIGLSVYLRRHWIAFSFFFFLLSSSFLICPSAPPSGFLTPLFRISLTCLSGVGGGESESLVECQSSGVDDCAQAKSRFSSTYNNFKARLYIYIVFFHTLSGVKFTAVTLIVHTPICRKI